MFYVCIIRKGKTKWTHNISYFIITPLGEVLHNKITWLWPTALWAVQTLQLCDGHPEHGLHYALYCWDDHQTSGSETLRETRCTLSIPFQLTFYFAPVVWYAVLISICVSAFTFVLFPLSLSLLFLLFVVGDYTALFYRCLELFWCADSGGQFGWHHDCRVQCM